MPPTSCTSTLDESLVGARVNPEYFPNLPEGFEEALVPLVIGDPGVRIPAARIDTDTFALAQGRIPSPTVYVGGEDKTSGLMISRNTHGGELVTTAEGTDLLRPSNRATFTANNSRTFTSGEISILTSATNSDPRPPIPDELKAIPSGEAYFSEISIPSTNRVVVRIGNFPTSGTPAASGPSLSDAWEQYERAITITAEGISITIPGPRAAGSSPQDDTEPYEYEPANIAEVGTFRTAWRALTNAQQDATQVTLDDGVPQDDVSVEWEGSGITDTELEGGSVITNPVRQIEKLLKLQGFDRDATEISAAAAVAASKGLGGALVFTDAEETLRRALERIAESYNATVFLAADGAGIRATRS